MMLELIHDVIKRVLYIHKHFISFFILLAGFFCSWTKQKLKGSSVPSQILAQAPLLERRNSENKHAKTTMKRPPQLCTQLQVDVIHWPSADCFLRPVTVSCSAELLECWTGRYAQELTVTERIDYQQYNLSLAVTAWTGRVNHIHPGFTAALHVHPYVPCCVFTTNNSTHSQVPTTLEVVYMLPRLPKSVKCTLHVGRCHAEVGENSGTTWRQKKLQQQHRRR